MSLQFTEVLRFQWKRDGHINVLETSALLTLLKSIAGGGAFGQRVSVGLDSRVALCATAKGRSSAEALGPVTQRIAAVLIASAIQLSLHLFANSTQRSR